MNGILIVDDDRDYRKQMAELLIDAGYDVTVTNSVATAIYGILKKTAQVVVLGSHCDELTAADLIPIMKKCNPKLPIILIAADPSLALLRKLRCEGIFYHALKPVNAADREEVCQAIGCALENIRLHPA